MSRGRGFTLMEIMIALGIAAVIISAGVAPLLYTSRMISNARRGFSDSNRERAAANRIFADIREADGLYGGNSVAIVSAGRLESGESDFMIVRTAATSNTVAPLGSAVWGIPRETVLRRDFKPGLYRWAISDDIAPDLVKTGELSPDDGNLLLPGLESVSFEALVDSSWVEGYKGGIPKALRVSFGYLGHGTAYEELLPNF
jgi:prepilin-type N-terminal cleavage/methylation domain-containing protein